ncbi:MAG: magnesium/cobalt transporter CorA [Chitinivibrionales bacterium]|nr:magnesium/cobalt transporter CorA [Chitinivibrionales bacterium]
MHLRRKLLNTAGLPPGTLVPSEQAQAQPVRLTVTGYDHKRFEERQATLDDYDTVRFPEGVVWVNVDGLGDVDLLTELGKRHDIHDLTLEDILNVEQRPKLEEQRNDGLFVIIKMLYLSTDAAYRVESEQVSLVLRGNMVFSFQQRPGDVFDPIRDRIRRNRGRVRRMGAQYLVYAIMDAVVDNYFVILERLSDEIESLESEILDDPSPRTAARIHGLRSSTLLLRRSIWPLREVINTLRRDGAVGSAREQHLFYRDLYDHTIQVIESLETFRDVLSGMLDLYMSSISNRMNNIMKVLTIISTMFIPLGFLAGLYGMNFEYMPELEWRWGYPAVLLVMILVVTGFLVFFRRRKWL